MRCDELVWDRKEACIDDILFGDYNPSGRLPFPSHVSRPITGILTIRQAGDYVDGGQFTTVCLDMD
jgi:hypothetical protein